MKTASRKRKSAVGIPGALGTLSIERCDACERFANDEETEKCVRRMLRMAPVLLATCKLAINALNGVSPGYVALDKNRDYVYDSNIIDSLEAELSRVILLTEAEGE